MREEEIKAIENAKQILKETTFLSDIGHKDLEILVNLITKRQKEIENSVSKDKIRGKINFLEEIGEDSVAHYMKDLL